MVDKPHNYLKYTGLKLDPNAPLSKFYSETFPIINPKTGVIITPVERIPSLGNEHLWEELGEDYNMEKCHCFTFVYTEVNIDASGQVLEEFAEKTVKHFLPWDGPYDEDAHTSGEKLAAQFSSLTDNTKFLNKDEVALVGYDRTL